MLTELDTDDWREVFGFAGEPHTYAGPRLYPTVVDGSNVSATPFTREDVVHVVGLSVGALDSNVDWLVVGFLHDGRVFCLIAGCGGYDWSDVGGGDSWVSHSLAHLQRFCVLQTSPELVADNAARLTDIFDAFLNETTPTVATLGDTP